MAAFSFVDDTDIIQTGSSGSEKDPEQIVSQLYSSTQNALNTWASILAATGGALEPTKTFYVPMIPEWKGNKANLKRMDHRHNLHLRDSNQEYTVLPKKDPNNSFSHWAYGSHLRATKRINYNIYSLLSTTGDPKPARISYHGTWQELLLNRL
jgi:hypothetical protein